MTQRARQGFEALEMEKNGKNQRVQKKTIEELLGRERFTESNRRRMFPYRIRHDRFLNNVIEVKTEGKIGRFDVGSYQGLKVRARAKVAN